MRAMRWDLFSVTRWRECQLDLVSFVPCVSAADDECLPTTKYYNYYYSYGSVEPHGPAQELYGLA